MSVRFNVITEHRVKGAVKAAGKLLDLSDASKKTALKFVGAAVAAGVLAEALRRNIVVAAAFQKGLIDVAKTSDLSGSALRALGKDIDSLSRVIPTAATGLLKIAKTAGQLGVTGAPAILAFTETLAKLEATTDIIGQEGATALARLLNVTGESAETVGTLGSVLVSLGNSFAATETQILSHAGEVARATAIYGVSSGEAAALGTALAAMGVQSELSGSAVGRSFIAINSAALEGGAALEAMAKASRVSTEEFRAAFDVAPLEAFKLFLSGLRKSGRDATTVLDSVGLSGIRLSKTLPVLAKKFGTVERALKLQAAEVANATALNDEFAKASVALTFQLQLLRNEVSSAAKIIGDGMLEGTTNAVKGTKDLISVNRNLIKDLVTLGSTIGSAVLPPLAILGISLLEIASIIPRIIVGITGISLVRGLAKDISDLTSRERELAAVTLDVAKAIASQNKELVTTKISEVEAAIEKLKNTQRNAKNEVEEFEDLIRVGWYDSEAIEIATQRIEEFTDESVAAFAEQKKMEDILRALKVALKDVAKEEKDIVKIKLAESVAKARKEFRAMVESLKSTVRIQKEFGVSSKIAADAVEILSKGMNITVESAIRLAKEIQDLETEIASLAALDAFIAQQDAIRGLIQLMESFRIGSDLATEAQELLATGVASTAEEAVRFAKEARLLLVQLEQLSNLSDIRLRIVGEIEPLPGQPLHEPGVGLKPVRTIQQIKFPDEDLKQSNKELGTMVDLMSELGDAFRGLGELFSGFGEKVKDNLDTVGQLADVFGLVAGAIEQSSSVTDNSAVKAAAAANIWIAVAVAILDIFEGIRDKRRAKIFGPTVAISANTVGGAVQFGGGVGAQGPGVSSPGVIGGGDRTGDGIPKEVFFALREGINSLRVALGGFLVSLSGIVISIRQDGEQVRVQIAGQIDSFFNTFAEAATFALEQALNTATFDGLGPILGDAMKKVGNIGSEAFLELVPILRSMDDAAAGLSRTQSTANLAAARWGVLLDITTESLRELGVASEAIVEFRMAEIALMIRQAELGLLQLAGVNSQFSALEQMLAAADAANQAAIRAAESTAAFAEAAEAAASTEGSLLVPGGGGPPVNDRTMSGELTESTELAGVAIANLSKSVDLLNESVDDSGPAFRDAADAAAQIPEFFIQAVKEIVTKGELVGILNQMIQFQERYGSSAAATDQQRLLVARMEFTIAKLKIILAVQQLEVALQMGLITKAQLEQFQTWARDISAMEFPGIDRQRRGTGTRRADRENFRQMISEMEAGFDILGGAAEGVARFQAETASLAEEMRRLNMGDLVADFERLRQVREDLISQNAIIDIETRIANIIGDEDALMALQQARQLAQLAFDRAQIEALIALGQLSEEMGAAILARIEEAQQTILNPPEPPAITPQQQAESDVELFQGFRSQMEALGASLPIDVVANLARLELELARARLLAMLADEEFIAAAERMGIDLIDLAGRIGAASLDLTAAQQQAADVGLFQNFLSQMEALGLSLPTDVVADLARLERELALARLLVMLADQEYIDAALSLGIDLIDLAGRISGTVIQDDEDREDDIENGPSFGPAAPDTRSSAFVGFDPVNAANDNLVNTLENLRKEMIAVAREIELGGMSQIEAEISRINDKWADFILRLQEAGGTIADIAEAERLSAEQRRIALEAFAKASIEGFKNLLDQIRGVNQTGTIAGFNAAQREFQEARAALEASPLDQDALRRAEEAARAFFQAGQGAGFGSTVQANRELIPFLENISSGALQQAEIERLAADGRTDRVIASLDLARLERDQRHLERQASLEEWYDERRGQHRDVMALLRGQAVA